MKRRSVLVPKPSQPIKSVESSHEVIYDDDNNDSTDDDDDDDEEEVIYPATIHIAIRKDASLTTMEKITSINKNMNMLDTAKCSRLITPPPDSPAESRNRYDGKIDTESDLILDLDLPPLINVQKKTNQSLKGLLKRSFQLNQYLIIKANSISLSNQHPYLLFKTTDSYTGKQKLMLKLNIVSVTEKTPERQRRFGFTFLWHQKGQQQEHQHEVKFAVAPDSLVKEALTTWIDSQNEQLKGDNIPSLFKADEILRIGRKVHVVYDAALFPCISF
ncbi:hypothetical protein BDF20DRAFT_830419 [Mycotypha africana]|uniref:uncharacterized protein n=1 Tax=Mycotypha africana TaxID=64632 RepID=UPI00230168E7|nr:uncharacterized protein BDF20DRAFT_830419 [Mycotypha africana]KAI8967032.1 hypothetical protein BDF20DRAFT_830419 [Mycotypha africana]